MEKLYKTWAEIDLGAVRDNIARIRAKLGRGVHLLAVVKADAYGHGMTRISRVALRSGASWLGVSNIYEALKLRKAHPEARILVLSAGMVGHAEAIVRHRVTPVICSAAMLDAVSRAALRAGRAVDIHAVVDTGMGRIGVWHEGAFDFIRRARRTRGVRLQGISSHFACASDRDLSFATLQLDRFRRVLLKCRRAGIRVPLVHIANSGALLGLPASYFNLARIGIMLYGVYPSREVVKSVPLRAALTLKTEICYLKQVPPGRSISYCRSYATYRDTAIATIPIGYGDGYCRLLSNRGEVLVRGRRAPVVGNVTMDQTMIDVGHIPGARVGDEVVVIGRQGDDEITVNEVADLTGTIPYDVMCAMGKQVQHRIYTGE
ncbi:MAG: alanine racemase [Candidatus Aureabacteria bacterium]|jgi:alanine racemase|nr:alanine racemase [Candidatus Auribacterota bacterium]NLW94306.1 alanine racemase [Chlamydiota bacterium]HOE26622.1 alanine racemase [bacterium]HQM52149.1 alanine racemase [bacterium]